MPQLPINQNQLIWLILWAFVVLAAFQHPILWIPIGLAAIVIIGDWLFGLV